MQLYGYSEKTVIARTGSGGHAVGHLALHHQHGTIKRLTVFGELEQDGRGDVVRQISDNDEALTRISGRRREIEREHIDRFDSYVRSCLSGRGRIKHTRKPCG